MGFTLERLAIDDPLQFYEQMGDPVADFGGTTVPAPRNALRHSVSLPTFTPSANATVSQLLVLRRQLRSLLNNTPYKLQGFYVNWSTDTEQNGWYVPDMGQLVDGDGASGLATGWFKLENVVWRKQAARRTHRRALTLRMLSLTTAQNPRDYKRTFYSSDFAQISPLAVTVFPPFATDLVNSSSGAAVQATQLSIASDGGSALLATGLANLATVSFEQPEAAQTQTGVVCYDRMGDTAASPDANWAEVYGPDWPWSWLATVGAPPDAPVLNNGYVQVRYDSSHTEGFIISVYNHSLATPLWVDQCKVWFQRYNIGLSTPVAIADVNLLSANVEEYSPERAVVKCVIQGVGMTDPSTRETVYITLQRGWSGPRIELYTAPTATATPLGAGAWICVTPVAVDADDSMMAIYGLPTNGGLNTSTALGTGHTGLFATTDVGGVSSLNDNGFAMLRANTAGAGGLATAYQISMATVQAGANLLVGATINPSGVATNTVIVQGPPVADYCSVQFAFPPALATQIMEAENMALGANTSSTADATASAGTAASTTRTSDANPHVSQAAWVADASGLSYAGVYRVFARCRTTAGTMSAYAKTTAGTGATVTTTSTSYLWLDLGDITVSPAGQQIALEIHAWTSAGTCYVDRIEAYLRQDRTSLAPQYEGCQDLGQMVMYDSQALGVQVSRA